jgi:hypothetical protein
MATITEDLAKKLGSTEYKEKAEERNKKALSADALSSLFELLNKYKQSRTVKKYRSKKRVYQF